MDELGLVIKNEKLKNEYLWKYAKVGSKPVFATNEVSLKSDLFERFGENTTDNFDRKKEL